MNNYLKYIFIGIFFILIGVSLSYIFRKQLPFNNTVIIHDTTVIDRFHTEIKKDTVIKWYEKIVYKNVLPNVIYETKIDSVFIETIKYKDVMLKVEKSGYSIKIFAVNVKDSLIKEYNFAGVGQDWTATSTTGNVFLKAKRLNWNGVTPYFLYGYGLQDNKQGFVLGIETGFTFTRLNINGYIDYNNKHNDLMTGLKLSYNLFR